MLWHVEYRQQLEDKTDALHEMAWRLLGEERTLQFLALIEPVGDRYVEEINTTAGDNWMPAARPRRR